MVGMKEPKCTICGGKHYQTFCNKKPKKPIKSRSKAVKRSKPLKSKKGITKPKKKTRSQLKDKAWKAFSDYIRLRDCLATTGTTTHAICITCKVRGDNSWKEYKDIQAGHAIGGRTNAILFHEELVNGQCRYCNRQAPYGLGGDYGNYAIALIERYGLEHYKELQKLRFATLKISTKELEEIEQKYKDKLKTLQNMV